MPVRKTTIVAADDDPQLLRLVTRNLEFEGYEVLPVSDGQQALEQVEAHSPDLVLLDVMMPRMDGFTVCQRVREFSAVPIIIVTARGQDQDKVRGLDLDSGELTNALADRSEEHTSELQSRPHLVCRLLLEKKKQNVERHLHPPLRRSPWQDNQYGRLAVHYVVTGDRMIADTNDDHAHHRHHDIARASSASP